MRLILTRHGETEENVKGISQGQLLPGILTKLGIEQAEKLALRLKDEKVDAIYSSDLARSADTAKIIAKYHPDAEFHLVEELRERDLKEYAGKNNAGILFRDIDDEMESLDSMRKRSKKLLDKVYDKYPDGTVIFVAHGGLNKSFIREIMGKPDNFKLEHQHNTSVSIFEIKEDKNHKVHLLNCKKHLD